jgi:hypothetical protein
LFGGHPEVAKWPEGIQQDAVLLPKMQGKGQQGRRVILLPETLKRRANDHRFPP